MEPIDPKKTIVLDLFNSPEDARIKMIGDHAMVNGRARFVVDVRDVERDGRTQHGPEGAKGDRYLRKLLAVYPRLRLTGRVKGPVDSVETIEVTVTHTPLHSN